MGKKGARFSEKMILYKINNSSFLEKEREREKKKGSIKKQKFLAFLLL